MIVSSIPGAPTILKLLDSLRTAVRELSARADKANEEFRIKTGRELHLRDGTLEEQAGELAAAIGEADAASEARKTAAQARFEKRKATITRAYQKSRDQALEAVEKEAGHRKYGLQKMMLQADKDRTEGRANAATALADLKASLAAEQQTLANLEALAQSSFRGQRKFFRALLAASSNAAPDLAADENQLLTQLRDLLARAGADLKRFRSFLVFRLLKFIWVWGALALCEFLILLRHFGTNTIGFEKAGGAAAASLLVILLLRYAACRKAAPLAASISRALGEARRLHDACFEKSETHYQHELQRLADEYQSATSTADRDLKRAMTQAGEQRVARRMESDGKAFRILAENDQRHRRRIAEIENEHSGAVERLTQASGVRTNAVAVASKEREAKLKAEYQAQWQAIQTEWQARLQPIYQTIDATNAFAAKLFPNWDDPGWADWKPPASFEHLVKFGGLDVDVEKLCVALPQDQRLTLPGPARFPAALSLAFPYEGSILLETGNTGHDAAIGGLNNIILRLLSATPPGRANFTIIDPVGLGQNFAGVMHLADYEEQMINNRIWTQPGQIEQKLADLNEHMEKVIQMYLRNEYKTIAEYNEQAGVIAEKYYFLVIADFPANFTEAAAKRLLSIAASGAKCGVYMLIHWDLRQPLPQDFIPDELRKSAFCVGSRGTGFVLTSHALPGVELLLDAPPSPEFAIEFIHKVGRSSRDSSRVEVPFVQVAPPDPEIWTEETTRELRVPIGRTGATKLQYLAIGKGTCQHALVAGKTGSGKSTLFHVMITNLALWCSPEQVEFYLVDFKKGVEFKCYAARHLPHARVVAIESDREFGLSVLQRVDDELKRRGDMFRSLGVQNIDGYKRAGGTEPMPRSLLIIDEFQELFVEDDTISQTASMLLDRIVRQGRAFGIHVILGSQTLGGAYTVARTTLGQMVIRIALQCNEADAYLIMDENNPAPRLLSRPGEGLYNDMAGALEGNSPFQTVWLPDEVRDSYLHKVRARADQNGANYPGPIVFEGNAPADVQDNPLLRALLEAESIKPAPGARIWLGAPNSIKGPTEAVFRRQSGNNLFLVGQRDEAILAIFSVGLVALAAQHPLGKAQFILLEGNAPGTPPREFLDRILQAIPHPVTVAKQNDLAEIMQGLGVEAKKRAEDPNAEAAPPIFLFIHGIQKFNRLRYDEELAFSVSDPGAAPNPSLVLNNLLGEGARVGIHVIASCDSYNNIGRFLSRKAFSEFELRVLFQMSANDSASLIDNPKASTLGLHRALFFDQQEGHLETFRPYALPGRDWIEHAERNLQRLLKG
jgi:S-DNA-T family DNA segregation ATPase FtsK/SpoIIIE